MVTLMEWMGRPLWPQRRKPPKSGQKLATLPIYNSSKQLKPCPPDQLPHTALMVLNEAMVSFWLYHPCFLHYRLKGYSKFQQIPTKHPTIPTSNMLKSHKNHRDDQPPSLLTASCEGPPPTPYHPFSCALQIWYMYM